MSTGLAPAGETTSFPTKAVRRREGCLRTPPPGTDTPSTQQRFPAQVILIAGGGRLLLAEAVPTLRQRSATGRLLGDSGAVQSHPSAWGWGGRKRGGNFQLPHTCLEGSAQGFSVSALEFGAR